MNKDKTDQFGRKLGSFLASVVALCLAAATIGLTVKFLLWLS